MGNRPRRRCSANGCPNAATYRGRCPDHAAQAETERSIKHGGTHRTDVYGTARWRNLKAIVLREEPTCRWRNCWAPATDVDHVVALQDGGDPWDRANLQPLCSPHHGRKTANEVKARRRRG